MQPAPGISIVTLFLNADVVVKGVSLLLLAASVWSWAVSSTSYGASARRAGRCARMSAGRRGRAPADLLSGPVKARDPRGPVLIAGLQSAVEVPAALESL
jgi:biopolymer transport protein ExbB/TolQ